MKGLYFAVRPSLQWAGRKLRLFPLWNLGLLTIPGNRQEISEPPIFSGYLHRMLC